MPVVKEHLGCLGVRTAEAGRADREDPGGRDRGGGNQPPDLEEILRRSQDKLRQAVPGGVGFFGTSVILLILAAGIAYFGFTVRINPDERAVVQRFGKFDRELGNGINFRWPYPVEEVTVIPYTRQNRVEVGFSTGISGPYGSIRNPAKPEESLMLTGDENIVDVSFNVFWNVKNASDYLFNVRNPGTNPDANANVKAVAESSMREVIGQNDIQPILTKSRQEIEEAVKALIQRTLDSYKSGVQITQVNLQKVDPPADVISAFRDVQAARGSGTRPQRGGNLCQPGNPRSSRQGAANPSGRPRLSRAGGRRGEGPHAALPEGV